MTAAAHCVSATTLDLLRRLPRAHVVSENEGLRFLEQHRLFGRGFGWTDVHLLAATALSQCELRTVDRRLHDAGRRLRLAFHA